MTDIAPLLRQRWSPKTFDPHHVVGDEDVRLLLEAARWAPSARNVQPWRFVVGRRGDATWTRMRPFVAGYSDWALDASLLVANLYEAWLPTIDLPLYDLGGAVAHMSLQGEALGLHARQFGTFDRDGFSRGFGVEPPFAVVTVTAFGVPPAGVRPEGRARVDADGLGWRPADGPGVGPWDD